jgi:hypothetical protein
MKHFSLKHFDFGHRGFFVFCRLGPADFVGQSVLLGLLGLFVFLTSGASPNPNDSFSAST